MGSHGRRGIAGLLLGARRHEDADAQQDTGARLSRVRPDRRLSLDSLSLNLGRTILMVSVLDIHQDGTSCDL